MLLWLSSLLAALACDANNRDVLGASRRVKKTGVTKQYALAMLPFYSKLATIVQSVIQYQYQFTKVGPVAHPLKEPNAGSWGPTHLITHPLSTGGPSLREKEKQNKHTAKIHILVN
jgi:hypothetical protein